MSLTRFQSARRLALAAFIAASFVALLFVQSAWPDGELHEFVEAIGLGLIVVGIVGRMWCTLYIGGRKSAEIVSSGPYSVTRNPLYVFSTIAAGGVGAQTGSIVLGLAFALCCAGAFGIVIRREEAFLAGEFGPAYDDYRRRVPRFWPRFGGFSDKGELRIRTRLVYRTLVDGLVFFLAMPAFELVEYLQALGIIPILLHLP